MSLSNTTSAPQTFIPVPAEAVLKHAPAPSPFDAYRARSRFSSLDGVRCLSILAVIWHHAGSPIARWPITANGFLGVDMFFVLSGFLIVTLLLRERDEHGRISLPAFYARRTLRIFPLYYGVLALLCLKYALSARGNASAAAYFGHLPYYLTYTSNWVADAGPLALTWSLATEEQFYLVWPACERFLPRRAIPILLLVALAINQAVNFGLADQAFGGWIGEHRLRLSILQATFTPVLLGVALAHLLHHRRTFWWIDAVLGRRWSSAVLLVVVALAASKSGDISGTPRLLIQLAMAAFLAACVVRDGHGLRPVLASHPFRAVGAVSYGMYLFHIFNIDIIARLLGRVHLDIPIVRFAAVAAVTFAAAQVSFVFFERPFLKLKHRFWRGKQPTSA